MPINIKLESNGLYSAMASPPDADEKWSTQKPLTADDLIGELLVRGAHQTDIGDAFYAADLGWLTK